MMDQDYWDTIKLEAMTVDAQQTTEYPWSKESILFMIQEIKNNPTLYDRQNTNYNDRKVRTATFTEIAKNIQTKYASRCSRQDVLEKWTDMKCNYFIEKKKVDQSLIENEDGIYKPTAYWYNHMQFIEVYTLPHEIPGTMRELLAFKAANSRFKTPRTPLNMRTSETGYRSFNYDPRLHFGRFEETPKRMRLDSFNGEDDSFDIFGRFIASELRSITAMGSKYIARRGKRSIQRCLIDMWDQVDYHSDGGDHYEDAMPPSPPPPPPSPPPTTIRIRLN